MAKGKSKNVAKAEFNLNWLWTIDYGLLWLYIYIHVQFSLFDTSVLIGFMISLFLATLPPRVQRAWNLMGTSVRNGLRFFLLFAKKYCFKLKLSFLINELFRNVFCVCVKSIAPCSCLCSSSSFRFSTSFIRNIGEFEAKSYFTDHRTANTIYIYGFRDSVPVLKIHGCY